ncbi:MAG: GIY-YIG nuclease family protein [Planctomycetota bacterium]|jgi:predicted GIY-YIG superfamily endonuclease
MNEKFRQFIDPLESSYQRLTEMKPFSVSTLPKEMPQAGIYLFSKGKRHLYAGRTNRLRQRLQEHCRPSSTHNSAPFAFRLARETTGQLAASYTEQGSRSALEQEPQFQTAFTEAKDRIRQMDVRFVGESDPMRQALLEMYVSVCLETPHNDFDNH